jgi:hypothetical protein
MKHRIHDGIDPQRIGIIGFSAGGAVSGGAAVRGQPAEIHIYAKGRHGFGTAHQGLPVDHWLDAFHAWLAQQGFVPQ